MVKVVHNQVAIGAVEVHYILGTAYEKWTHPFAALSFPDLKQVSIYFRVDRVFCHWMPQPMFNAAF